MHNAETTLNSPFFLLFWGLLLFFLYFAFRGYRRDGRREYSYRRRRRRRDYYQDDYPDPYDDEDDEDYEYRRRRRILEYRRNSDTLGCLPVLLLLGMVFYWMVREDTIENPEVTKTPMDNSVEDHIQSDTIRTSTTEPDFVPVYLPDEDIETSVRPDEVPTGEEPHWTELDEPEDRIIQTGVYSHFKGALKHARELRDEKNLGDYVQIGLRDNSIDKQYIVYIGVVGQTHARQIIETYGVKGFIKVWGEELIVPMTDW